MREATVGQAPHPHSLGNKQLMYRQLQCVKQPVELDKTIYRLHESISGLGSLSEFVLTRKMSRTKETGIHVRTL